MIMVIIFGNVGACVGTHKGVTPVTLVCSRSEEGRRTVFCR